MAKNIIILLLSMPVFYPVAYGQTPEQRTETALPTENSIHSAEPADNRFPANCSIPVPELDNWETEQTTRIEFRISDLSVAYLGVEKFLRNPDNEREFVWMVSRHIPFIPQKREIDPRSFADNAAADHIQAEEQNAFESLSDRTDPVFYLRWMTKESSRNGRDVLDDKVDIWFLRSSGECLIVQNEEIGTQFLTENIGNGNSWNVFVGVRYRVGDDTHILKVDRQVVSEQMKEGG